MFPVQGSYGFAGLGFGHHSSACELRAQPCHPRPARCGPSTTIVVVRAQTVPSQCGGMCGLSVARHSAAREVAGCPAAHCKADTEVVKWHGTEAMCEASGSDTSAFGRLMVTRLGLEEPVGWFRYRGGVDDGRSIDTPVGRAGSRSREALGLAVLPSRTRPHTSVAVRVNHCAQTSPVFRILGQSHGG